jgi:uncharacterized integral membrane protein
MSESLGNRNELSSSDSSTASAAIEVDPEGGADSFETGRIPRTRTGMAWLAACTAALISIALIVFMVQNTATVPVYFLWMTGNTSLGLMLLIAALGGIVVTLILGSARIIQLRHVVRRNAKQSRAAAHTS